MSDIVDGRYRIEHQLAVGGFGTIYRATDTTIGRQVALKILHRELAGDGNVVARFRRESAALAKLRSPHTLTLYDVGEHDDTLYFVMELLRGESLLDVFTRTGPLPWRRVAHIARGVCASLLEAHALGIVHRDLKPANIFLERHSDDADYVKVLDFGIAKAVASDALDNRDLTRHGQMIGTFDYMSPEQMVGAPCTSKTDLFTLGIVMYEMLAGSRPFGVAHNPAQMLMALMTHAPTPLTGVPSDLARIVMKCLAREPHERPAIEQLDAVLARVLGNAAFGDGDEATI
jgi:eukaryotic-like serine/threonine-protein kinase